jgi:methionyl aminopeptidase
MNIAKRCMELGIEQARPGKRLGDIGAAIQQHAEANGFSVVREYTGHGVGRTLHEDPTVFHIGKPGTGMPIRPGMVFTVEPMINAGEPETQLMRDGWTVKTADGSRSAQFEHSIAITENGPELLTLP